MKLECSEQEFLGAVGAITVALEREQKRVKHYSKVARKAFTPLIEALSKMPLGPGGIPASWPDDDDDGYDIDPLDPDLVDDFSDPDTRKEESQRDLEGRMIESLRTMVGQMSPYLREQVACGNDYVVLKEIVPELYDAAREEVERINDQISGKGVALYLASSEDAPPSLTGIEYTRGYVIYARVGLGVIKGGADASGDDSPRSWGGADEEEGQD